jgi:hypothetical protein
MGDGCILSAKSAGTAAMTAAQRRVACVTQLPLHGVVGLSPLYMYIKQMQRQLLFVLRRQRLPAPTDASLDYSSGS